MESSTKILRRLLDERGVEWEDASPVPSMKPWKTSFTSFTGEEVTIGAYDEPKWLMGTMVFHTPEQAIAATLGSCNCSDNCTNSERTETCYDTGERRIFHCSECGLGMDDVYVDDETLYPPADFPRFCPWCGAKVVGSTTNDVDAEVDA